jgi:hypothetical protein
VIVIFVPVLFVHRLYIFNSRVNEGFYFLLIKNSSDFDKFFFNVRFYILIEIRNILVRALNIIIIDRAESFDSLV